MEVIDLTSRQINVFLHRRKQKKIVLVARPGFEDQEVSVFHLLGVFVVELEQVSSDGVTPIEDFLTDGTPETGPFVDH